MGAKGDYMELTPERRAELLTWGGYGDASRAPLWAQQRILEIRQAIVENRAVPPPSRQYVAEAEQRSLAQKATGFVRRLSPKRQTEEQRLAETAKRNRITVEQLVDAELRLLAKRQAAEIAATSTPASSMPDENRSRRNALGLPWRASY